LLFYLDLFDRRRGAAILSHDAPDQVQGLAAVLVVYHVTLMAGTGPRQVNRQFREPASIRQENLG